MPPPRIIVQPMNITRLVKQNATFVCVGQGYGFVDVRWAKFKYGNEKSLRRKSIVTTTVTPNNITSILTIPDARSNDVGRYECEYNNTGGGRVNKAKLSIVSKYQY